MPNAHCQACILPDISRGSRWIPMDSSGSARVHMLTCICIHVRKKERKNIYYPHLCFSALLPPPTHTHTHTHTHTTKRVHQRARQRARSHTEAVSWNGSTPIHTQFLCPAHEPLVNCRSALPSTAVALRTAGATTP